jgi:hypothetical protein
MNSISWGVDRAGGVTQAGLLSNPSNTALMNLKPIRTTILPAAPPNSLSNSPVGTPRATAAASGTPLVEPARERPNLAPHAVVALLNDGDKAGFSAVLDELRSAQNTSLDLHGEKITPEGMRCLAEVLDERRLSSSGLHITHIDLSDAQFGELKPLMDTLKAYGGITWLDFSGAQSLDEHGIPLHGATGMSERALGLIANFVGSNTALCKLSLNRQPALGARTHMDRLDFSSQLKQLLAAVAQSSLVDLELRNCGFVPQDWHTLRVMLGWAKPKLQRLDLKGNDQMASIKDIRARGACGSMVSFIASLNLNRHLKELILPSPAVAWFQAGMLREMSADFKASLALPENRTLERIAPLTDSAVDDPTLKALRARTRLAQRQRELITLIWCMRENRYGGGVPPEIEKLIIKTPPQEPPQQ